MFIVGKNHINRYVCNNVMKLRLILGAQFAVIYESFIELFQNLTYIIQHVYILHECRI